MAQETETPDENGLHQRPLLLDFVDALERLKAAREAVKEAEEDVSRMTRYARRMLNGNVT